MDAAPDLDDHFTGTVSVPVGSGFAGAAGTDLLNNVLKRYSDAPHDPDEYLDLRDDSPDMLKRRSLVIPDPAAVARLNQPRTENPAIG